MVFSPVSTINDRLTDDALRSVLAKLEGDKDKEAFGLVCKRWLMLQSTERKRLAAGAGPLMLQKIASRFSMLLELDLSQSLSRSFYPGLSDSDLAVVAGGFVNLRVLILQNCTGITDNGMQSIASGLSSLQSLDVSYCKKLTDKGFLEVAQSCRDMCRLHLTGCRLISDSTLKAVSENCANLKELSLQGCTKVTDSGLTDLVSCCRRIEYLNINKCSNVGDMGVSKVSKACGSLRTLKLLDCYKVGNESILSMATFCKSIETLIIGGCRDISNESLKSLAAECNATLKNLRMDWCLNVSDSSLSCILTKCKNLEHLDIGCCKEITDAAFNGLSAVDTMLKLRFLKASNCPKITVNGIGILLEKCKSLEYLDVRSCAQVTETGCAEAGLQFPKCCTVKFEGYLYDPGLIR